MQLNPYVIYTLAKNHPLPSILPGQQQQQLQLQQLQQQQRLAVKINLCIPGC